MSQGEIHLMASKQRIVGLRGAVYAAAAIALLSPSLPAALFGITAAAAGTTTTPDAARPTIPDPYKQSMLIRSTLIALSQANQTGNYSVVRDLGTPQFQAANSSAHLAEIFAALRKREIDFSPVMFFDPELVRAPSFEGSVLRLTGLVPTKPERILFDMGFELIAGKWRLSAVVIEMQPTPAAAAPGQSSGAEAGALSTSAKSKKNSAAKP